MAASQPTLLYLAPRDPTVGAGWQSTPLDCVLIHSCGNGHLGFRPEGGSLCKSRDAGPGQSKQNALAPPLGTSLGLGVPVIRQRGSTGRLRSRAAASHRGYLRLLQNCVDTYGHCRQASSHILSSVRQVDKRWLEVRDRSKLPRHRSVSQAPSIFGLWWIPRRASRKPSQTLC